MASLTQWQSREDLTARRRPVLHTWINFNASMDKQIYLFHKVSHETICE